MFDPIYAGYYEIDPAGDLTIKVIELDDNTFDANRNHPILKTALMKVSREVLMKNSTHLKAMLDGSFKESGSDSVELEEDTICSTELWFRALHGNLVDDSYLIETKEIWEAIAFGRKYLVHMEKLNDWFAIYWSRLNKENLEMDDLKELLYPAQAFDHPVAFAYITRTMAHTGAGHIEERNPTRYYHLHVEGRVIQQINAAKGSMRKEITKGLFSPLKCFCTSSCSVNEKSLKAYVDGLQKTKIWPLETVHTRSNDAIIGGPGFVNWKCNMPEGACYSCTSKLRGNHVLDIRTKILKYWQGLCLDCMDISTPRTGDIDKDYWLHNDREDWSRGCRIQHQRNTWYFSFMGRPEIMSSFVREQQERKKAARRRHSDSDSD